MVTLVGRVESVLSLEGVDNHSHGHVDSEDKDLGANKSLPEVHPATNQHYEATLGQVIPTVVAFQPSAR